MILQVDPAQSTPAYEQLCEQLADAILGGQLQAGERLAPIRQLAKDLCLAPGTVARAYRELEQRNLIASHGRQGTIVVGRSEGEAVRADEITAIVDTCATRLERLGLSPKDAAHLLRTRMS